MTKRRKKRTHMIGQKTEQEKVPKSFVMKTSKVGVSVGQLVQDVRKVMEPHTAIKLKESHKNKLKDFIQVSGFLGITHFLMFSQTEIATYFRLAKTPRGPTLTFKVKGYSLMKDIRKTQKSPKSLGMEFTRPPLLVMNNFTHEDLPQGKLVTTMFQHMLPPINIQKMRLGDAKRILLLNYNADANTIDFRHYRIEVKESGVSRGVRKLFNGSISDLSKFNDISDFVKREDLGAESDMEDGPDNQVTLDSSMGRSGGNQTRSVKLYEIGPRMDLELIKIEAGLNGGETLYHRNIKRSNAEQKKINRELNVKNQEKAQRRLEQEKNVQRKKEEMERHKAITGAKVKDEDEDEDVEISENISDSEEIPNAKNLEEEDGDDDDEDLFDEDEEVDQDEVEDDDDDDDSEENAAEEVEEQDESDSEDESIPLPPPTKSKKLRK